MRWNTGAFPILLWLFVIPPVVASATTSGSDASKKVRKLVIGVDGGTESIRACCFDALTGQVVGESCASPYKTHHPKPGWAEQSPLDWYENLGISMRKAIESIENDEEPYEICAICMDTTCCSVVFLDDSYEPIRTALLWMDARSAPQTQEILQKCKGDPALAVNCGGEGPLSAEWMTPKSLWVRQNEPDVWKKANTICEYQDYLNYKLTETMVASSCNAASRWHWNGDECILEGDNFPGRPLSLYKKLGIPELAKKLPRRCLPMGSLVGTLTSEAAAHLNLPEGLPVVQGGADAFVGMIGLGCIHPGQLCLITGSSHLHCVVSSKPSTAPGTWGAYRGAPLPGLNFAEGGQSSTGSIVRWAKDNLFKSGDGQSNNLSYKSLDEEASGIPPGCDGLVALETFQGSRTPVTDPRARGALIGLTLSHTRAHVWRALLEAVCFGTRACVEGLAKAGHDSDEIIIAGGATRSPLWLQMHADITGLPVIVCENGDAPLLGCAILASVGVGIHEDVESAVKSMVRRARRVEPDENIALQYTKLYKNIYSKVVEQARPIAHAISDLRGGAESDDPTAVAHSPAEAAATIKREKSEVRISPSVLAADWADMRGEVHRCIESKASRLHVDVFDGVFLDSPYALTFGPQMVDAIRRSCDASCLDLGLHEKAILDLHMCVDRPRRYIEAMKLAGADRFIFQWEAMTVSSDDICKGISSPEPLEKAIQLAKDISEAGMNCGVSINPATDIAEIFPLLETGLVDLVDILSVEPGFGGQSFQPIAITKIEGLRRWREQSGLDFDILVDGGRCVNVPIEDKGIPLYGLFSTNFSKIACTSFESQPD
jgi:ribulose-phosphate 3-epimerase